MRMSPSLEKGVFLLSIDTELAWGGVHSGAFAQRTELYRRTRDAIDKLLLLQGEYGIKATWAFAGHLMLESCSPENGIKHPEIARPSYQWHQGDWFENDPCGNVDTHPFWYGPDIVEKVLNGSAKQEIGCHCFSHMIIGDPGCAKETFASELQACREAAEAWGIKLESFVFPRNAVGHLDVLKEQGFTNFRGVVPGWYRRLPPAGQKIGRGMQNVLALPPLTVRPSFESGLWNLPGSAFYLHRVGWAKRVPVGLRVFKAKLGLSEATRNKTIFHLWFHPFNLATDSDVLLNGLRAVFRRAAELQERGVLDNYSMGELAASLDAKHEKTLG